LVRKLAFLYMSSVISRLSYGFSGADGSAVFLPELGTSNHENSPNDSAVRTTVVDPAHACAAVQWEIAATVSTPAPVDEAEGEYGGDGDDGDCVKDDVIASATDMDVDEPWV
jgi:hypothetical protein